MTAKTNVQYPHLGPSDHYYSELHLGNPPTAPHLCPTCGFGGTPKCGLVDKMIYKITSAADMSVLGVKANRKKKDILPEKIINCKDENGCTFSAKKLGIGFHLTILGGQVGQEDPRLLTYDYPGLLNAQLVNNEPTQLFMTKETRPGSNMFFIKSLFDNSCLRNNGIGIETTMVPEDPESVLQWWKLESP